MRSIARADRPALDRWGARALALGLALVVCLPLLGGGVVLRLDMVFVPDPALGPRGLGLDDSVPRAVPMDFLLAAASRLFSVDVLQQAALLAVVGVAALGAWRATPARTLPGAAAAATCFAWNPYVGERLSMGHWSLLLGYAALPWLVVSARRLAASEPGAWARMSLVVVAGAVVAPTSGILTATLALALVLVLRVRLVDRLTIPLVALVANATWVVPGLLASGRLADSRHGVHAFAVTGDTALGGVGSVITGGGIWNATAHLESRDGVVPVVFHTAAVLAVLGYAVLRARALPADRTLVAVTAVGVVGLAIAAMSTLEGGRDLLVLLADAVPGGPIIRDAHKWLAWWMLLVAMLAGPAVDAVVRRLPGIHAVLVGAMVAAVPVAVTPDLAWGVGGRLERVRWPDEYAAVAELLDERPGPGAVLVLPWHAYRAWPWNEWQPVLDPWTRLVRRDVVVRDDLELTGTVVPGEDPRARRVGELLARDEASSTALRELGIRYVLVDTSTVGDTVPPPPGRTLHEGDALLVVDLGPVPEQSHRTSLLVIGVDVLVAILTVGMAVALLRLRARRLLVWRRSAPRKE